MDVGAAHIHTIEFISLVHIIMYSDDFTGITIPSPMATYLKIKSGRVYRRGHDFE